jgi:phospholipid/cholesterol/gamma-HCH transport system substrate-binding protein
LAVVITGLVVTAAILAFVYFAEQSYNGLPFISYRTLYASVPNIGHLQLHDPVQIAGVRVGQVLSTDTRNGRALVQLQLQGVGPLPVDTQVYVRANGLLGARDAEIVPGKSKQLLADGATISGGTNTYYQGVPETLDLFNAKTRGALGQMIGGLGQGMLGRGQQLNDAIRVGPPSGVNFNTVAYSILSKPGSAAQLLPATDAGVTALNAARENIAGMFAPGATTLQALIDKRTQFDQAISQAPSTMDGVTLGLGAPAQRLLASLRSLSFAADGVLPAAPLALRSATQLLQQGPRPLQKARVVLDQVPSAVPSTLQILSSLQPDLAPLTQAFTNLVGPVTSLGQHGCDLKQFSVAWRSVLLHGVNPGGPFGPLDGFRAVAASVGPGELSQVAPAGLLSASFPQTNIYKPACMYVPGSTYDPLSLSTLLGTK